MKPLAKTFGIFLIIVLTSFNVMAQEDFVAHYFLTKVDIYVDGKRLVPAEDENTTDIDDKGNTVDLLLLETDIKFANAMEKESDYLYVKRLTIESILNYLDDKNHHLEYSVEKMKILDIWDEVDSIFGKKCYYIKTKRQNGDTFYYVFAFDSPHARTHNISEKYGKKEEVICLYADMPSEE